MRNAAVLLARNRDIKFYRKITIKTINQPNLIMNNLQKTYSILLEQRQGKGFSESQVTELLKQVLSQLAQIHNQGGVHGAISLDSLIKDENSQQTLLIFSPELTLPIRFPPEQLRTGQITATGDIYALGVTAIALLTGKLPEDLQNEYGMLDWQDDCTVTDQLIRILETAIAPLPHERYDNAMKMLMAMNLGVENVTTGVYNNLEIETSNFTGKTNSDYSLDTKHQSSFKPVELAAWQWILIGAVVTGLFLFLGFKLFLSKNESSPAIVNNNTGVVSPVPAAPVNPFESRTFPQSSCGDPPPADANAYPVNFYPVYVAYSDSNLATIKYQFCGDAYRMRRKDRGIFAIQVGSFTSLETAQQFANFLNSLVGSAEVGEPRTIQYRNW